MHTPWGELATLDLTDGDLCLEILASEKHQLVEGLVVESVFDQIFEDVPAYLEGAVLLDAETAIVDTGRGDDGWHAFVWVRDRERATGLGRYLAALGKRFRVWLVETDDPLTTFLVRPWADGKLAPERRPLAAVAREISGRRPQQLRVAEDVRDAVRQRQSFWGFLHGQHGDATGLRVILPRLFMNYGIQPWFRRVWNLDRILVHGDDIWLLELKHKYPMRGLPLSFGLNTGELGMIVRLGEAGIRCLHAIVVKPVWSMIASPMYLFNDMRKRARAALIAVDLDADITSAMLADTPASSASHTTFSGEGSNSFYRLRADRFSRLGILSDPAAALASGIAGVASGSALPPVEDRWLLGLKATN
jgi:hypothetical protein